MHCSAAPFARLAALTFAIAALAACGKPKPVALGDDPGIAPQLALVDSEKPPQTFNVTLAEPAHVVILAVFPGRGATIIHPGDTTGTTQPLPAGTQRIRADTVLRPASVDSAILRPYERRREIRDTTQARLDSVRAARSRERMMDPNARAMFLADHAHILVFASRSPVDIAALRRRVLGVTIPLDPKEALRTVANMARSATPGGRWAATAVEADLVRD